MEPGDATLCQNQPDNSVATPLAWGQMYADTMVIENLRQYCEGKPTPGM